jgi:hypothetical protein
MLLEQLKQNRSDWCRTCRTSFSAIEPDFAVNSLVNGQSGADNHVRRSALGE